MRTAKRYSNVIGCVGLLCLALYWVPWIDPKVADVFPVSAFGKISILGIFLASAPLTAIAAIRGSRWWWAAVAAAAITIWDLYKRSMTLIT